jgi:hypothetical protein
MKVHVKIDQDSINVDEAFAGNTADEIVGQMKARVARELSFAMRLGLNALSNLAFAQEVVKRLNQAHKLNLPIPNSCDEFLRLAQEQGYATIVEVA